MLTAIFFWFCIGVTHRCKFLDYKLRTKEDRREERKEIIHSCCVNHNILKQLSMHILITPAVQPRRSAYLSSVSIHFFFVLFRTSVKGVSEERFSEDCRYGKGTADKPVDAEL